MIMNFPVEGSENRLRLDICRLGSEISDPGWCPRTPGVAADDGRHI